MKETQVKQKHRKAIRNLYRTHGVGRTVRQKLAFWKQFGDYSISHNPTDAQKVVVLEACWAVENFPEDFVFC